VSPATGLRPSQVRLAPIPSGPQLRQALASVINLPLPLVVRPIYVSSPVVRAGDKLIVAAPRLSVTAHKVLFILQGPSFRADHLVAARDDVAAGVVRLPRRMTPGTWYVAAEDLAQVHPSGSRGLVGVAIVDIGTLTVG